MKRTIVTLFLTSLFNFWPAEHSFGAVDETKTIMGVVTDDEKKPISGSLCVLRENSQIGTVSDPAGYFSFVCSAAFLSDTLEVSFLGYKNQLIPLSELTADTLKIELKKSAILLKNVDVSAQSDSLGQLFLKAYKRIQKNSPKKLHQLDGFYRRVTYENDTAVNMAEVAFILQDPGILKPANEMKLKSRAIDKVGIGVTQIRFIYKKKESGICKLIEKWSIYTQVSCEQN
ncbi:MAG: hypothetical protein ACJA2S_002671 [Cyclobacteriaceae bacterium]|jgi:hypothetical protein